MANLFKLEEFKDNFTKIYRLYSLGVDEKEIASILGMAISTVNRSQNLIRNCQNATSFTEFCQKMDTYPSNNFSHSARELVWITVKGFKPPVEETKKAEPQTAIPTAQPSKDYSVYLSTLIAKQTETNELLTQLMDTVIPKYISDIQNELSIIPDYTQTLMGIIKVVQDIAPSLTSTLGETVRINLNKYCTDLLNQMKNDAYRSEAIKKSVQAIETKKFWSK